MARLTLESTACPHCGVSLLGAPIPQESRDNGWYGKRTNFMRQIAIEMEGEDYASIVKCPDCGAEDARETPRSKA